MATLRGTQGEPGRTPWGWIFGLLVVLIAAFVIIWWTRAGAPPADVTGQEARDVPAQQPGAPVSPAEQPPPPVTPPPQNP